MDENNIEKNGYIELFKEDKSFQELANVYFNKNFGMLNKSEIDLLMFKILYRKLEEKNNSAFLSDISLAKRLGITKQRVKSLKERMELKYPKATEEDWKEKFKRTLQNEKFEYDPKTMEFRALVDDAMLRYAIEESLESKSLIMDYSMNSKIITIRRVAFLSLLVECAGDDKKLEAALAEAKKESLKDIKEQKKKKAFWGNFAKDVSTDVLKSLIVDAIKIIVPAFA